VSTIVVILARAGSVRLPGKNAAMFAGKPMIAWTFERALALHASGLADHLAVSTDDTFIQQNAPDGIEVIRRPAELATATATSYDAMSHAVAHVEQRKGRADRLVLLQPTSPLASVRSTNDLVRRAVACGAESCMSIASLAELRTALTAILPERQPSAKGNGVRRVAAAEDDTIWPMERVPDEQATHLITGAVYVLKREAFFQERAYFLTPPRTLGFVVPAFESIDIDTPDDFATASAIVHAGKTGHGSI